MKKIFAIFLLYHLFRTFIIGITTPPIEGDSLAYHIPIAQNLWSGGLFHPKNILHFYPSVGEMILSFFFMFHIPANLFNVLGIALLTYLSYLLGKRTGLKEEMAFIFSVSTALLNISLRWINTQVIDIWLAVFFVWSLFLIQKPLKNIRDYILYGISLGLLIGTKNSGPGFALILFIIYWKHFTQYLSLKKFFYFLIPLSIFGLFWYVRNYFLMGNPLYPQGLLGMQGAPNWNILQWNIGTIALAYPEKLINALISEYMVWIIALFIPLFRLHQKIVYLGYANLLLVLFLPTTPDYSIIVSSLRYTYPMLVPLLLATFLIAERNKKQSIITTLALLNILFLPGYTYQPKLLFVFFLLMIPLGLWLDSEVSR